ncbi:MAG: carbon storage regulator [Caulobacteraceae bacterium]|nr:carbon storage regulator [Caulobacteraceae bacterium]
MQLFFLMEGGTMLVLGRKQGEAVIIGDRTEVLVKEIRGNKVKLAINAPQWIKIDRKEVWLKLAETKEEQS